MAPRRSLVPGQRPLLELGAQAFEIAARDPERTRMLNVRAPSRRTLDDVIREDNFTFNDGGPMASTPYPFPQPNAPRGGAPFFAPTGGSPTIIPRFAPGAGGGSSSGGSICAGLTGWKKWACEHADDAIGAVGGYIAGRRAGGEPGATQMESCPPGYVRNAEGGCQLAGPAPYIPGDVGRPDFVWTPINGRFGAGVTPIAVQRIRRECPPGMVLGKDGVCYDSLARSNRAWNPGAKPLLTGGDMNAIRRTRRVEKRWSKVAGAFGKKVVAKGKVCGPKKRRAR